MTHQVAMDEARPFFESALLQLGADWEVSSDLLPISNSDPSHWPSGVRSARVVLRHRSTGALKVLGERVVDGRNTTCHRALSLLVIDAYRDGNTDPIRRFFEEIGVASAARSRAGLRPVATGQRPAASPVRDLPRQAPVTRPMPVVAAAARPMVHAEVLPMERRPMGSRPDELRGTFAALGIVEVLQAIGLARKTGRLSISLGREAGMIVVESGTPIHAGLGELSGPAAFTALVDRAQRDLDALFTFRPGPSLTAPRTIHDSLERLLFSAAFEIDEGAAAQSAVAEAAAALAV